ncbi:polyketide cyclase / dehydrase and lipid transport [Nocardia asteroides]|uniref:polyketide cyclase / dehydrase and lipid transport n=1 Tax=Nocardia asteroides TaxID=1824 RepID=UPI003435AB62
MSSIQVADQTFLAAPPAAIADVLSATGNWRRWWPDLRLDVREDRGDKGIRWTVAGPLDGTMEVWLEAVPEGAILHYFLHAEPTSAKPLTPRALAAANRARRVAGKDMSFELKARLEAGRPAGVAPAAAAAS